MSCLEYIFESANCWIGIEKSISSTFPRLNTTIVIGLHCAEPCLKEGALMDK